MAEEKNEESKNYEMECDLQILKEKKKKNCFINQEKLLTPSKKNKKAKLTEKHNKSPNIIRE